MKILLTSILLFLQAGYLMGQYGPPNRNINPQRIGVNDPRLTTTKDFFGKPVALPAVIAPQTGDMSKVKALVDRVCQAAGIPNVYAPTAQPGVGNCLAVHENQLNYLFYEPSFLGRDIQVFGVPAGQNINVQSVDWHAMMVLCHELGHFALGHTANPAYYKNAGLPTAELQADEFGGKVLFALGASLPQALDILQNQPVYATGNWPLKQQRLDAISKGWNDAYAKSHPQQPSMPLKNNHPYAQTNPAPTSPAPAPNPSPTQNPPPNMPLKNNHVYAPSVPRPINPALNSMPPSDPIGIYVDMVPIQGGSFQMGSDNGDDNERPVHQVTVNDFYLSKKEVTQSQWKRVMATNPSYFSNCAECPVERVSWNDALVFIDKLNQLTNGATHYRLPTEAEWEYAAKGGIGQQGATMDASPENLAPIAWFADNCTSKTRLVARKQPNTIGLYDMAGNVGEWCNDWFSLYNNQSQQNPTGPSMGTYKIYRGGSWMSDANLCRYSKRYAQRADFHDLSVGFRLAESK